MSLSLTSLLFILLAYLMGSLSSAIIICRAFGLPDPRSEGSGNPGATNVMRIGGKKLAALTLVGDLVKGLIPVVLVKLLGATDVTIALVAVAAFLGHLFPLFFNFQGGKGVATAFGAILGLNPLVALCAFAVWLVSFISTRISSLSALLAAIAAPLFLYLFRSPFEITLAVIFMDLFLIYRHKANIERLLKGEEKRF